MSRIILPEAALYDEAYFQRHYNRDPRREKMYLLERDRILRYKDSGLILDIGCGVGGFLSRFDPSRWDRYGVEVSNYAAQRARMMGVWVNEMHKAYDYPDRHFDVIMFRGTIQHIPTPLMVLKRSIKLLKDDGLMVFLATPNASSICYKRWEELPCLDPPRNFYLPSDRTLGNILHNFGMEVVEWVYPYLGTPYAEPVKDHVKFFISLFRRKPLKFAFWRNMMECYARKK